MAANRLSSTFAAATGRWAISWQAYLVSFPAAMLGAFGEINKASRSAAESWLSLGFAFGTCSFLGIYLLVLHLTFFRHRVQKTVAIWKLLVSALGAGVFYSLGIAAGKSLLGQEFLEGLVFQIIANSLLISWWGTTLATLLDSREQYALQRDRVIEDAISLEMVKVRGSNTESRLRNSLNKQISSEISEARSVLNSALSASSAKHTDAKWQPIAAQLRLIANDVMRPLSKKLWESASKVFPKPSFAKVIKTIVTEQPLRPASLSLVVVLLSAATLTRTFGPTYGSIVLIATVVFIWILMPLASLWMRKKPKLHSALFFATVVLFQIFDTLAWLWAASRVGITLANETLWVNVFASLILITVTSGSGAYGNVSESDLQRFRSEISKQELGVFVRNKIVATLAQEAARNLHGKIQTRLISCASAIERATNIGDIDLLNRALIEVNEIFDSAVLQNDNTRQLQLAKQLEVIKQRWNGICETTLAISPPARTLVSKAATDVADVIEEAITNAVRHGNANKVQITVRSQPKALKITVVDNGSGFNQRIPGVGTELIRLVSAGNFDYATGSNGTTLTLEVLK